MEGPMKQPRARSRTEFAVPTAGLAFLTAAGLTITVLLSLGAQTRTAVLTVGALSAALLAWGSVRAIREQRLRLALQQLESLREVRLRSVHHELYGPLTTINGHAQLLQEILPGQEAATRSVEAILDAVKLMDRVIGELGGIIEDPTSHQPTTLESVDVAAVTRRAVQSIPELAARCAIDVPGGIEVPADPTRLQQALLLVLRNAEKYAPKGRISLTVHAQGGHAVITIADEGPGLPPEELRRVLEPYFRSATAESESGSGLGLHIANGLMAAMGGRIELASEPPGGLKVELHLPLVGQTTEAAVKPEDA
jgi:signal transduction histidine kinase